MSCVHIAARRYIIEDCYSKLASADSSFTIKPVFIRITEKPNVVVKKLLHLGTGGGLSLILYP
jgi:hypothetical protein